MVLINKDIFNALISVKSFREAGAEQLTVSPMPGRVT